MPITARFDSGLAGFSTIRATLSPASVATPKRSGSGTCLRRILPPRFCSRKLDTALRMFFSMMLSPRITQIGLPPAQCSHRESAAAMPPSPCW